MRRGAYLSSSLISRASGCRRRHVCTATGEPSRQHPPIDSSHQHQNNNSPLTSAAPIAGNTSEWQSLKKGLASKASLTTLNALNSILNVKIQNKADLGWLQRTYPSPPVDVTPKFEDLIARIERADDPSLWTAPKGAAEFVYCFVGGLWSNLAPKWFLTAKSRFKNLGLESEQATIDTSAGVAENATVLRQAIPDLSRKYNKKVILIGHRGVDSLSCLLMFPEVQSYVGGLITVQSPIGGSVLANDFMFSESIGRHALDLLFIRHVSGPDYKCILDLTIEARKKMLEEFPLHQRLQVPMLNFASHIWDHHNEYYRGLFDYSKENYDIEGDGFVALPDAIVPGYQYINVEGVTHIGTGSMLGLEPRSSGGNSNNAESFWEKFLLSMQGGRERFIAADIHHALVFSMNDIINSSSTDTK